MITYIAASACSPSDKEFMVQLVKDYNRMMFSVAKQYEADQGTREDIIQDSLEKLIQKVSVLRQMESCILAGYIATTVRHTAINQLRKDSKRKERQCEWNEQREIEYSSDSRTLEDLLVLSERKSKLWQIWPRLSEEERFLLEGKYILGYDNSELALQFGCKPDSIRMKLTRARRKAFDLMCEEEGDCDGKE